MADNDFEKRVQQMMGQLKLQPSETVWQNVEAQINKKKRRRWLLLLLLPALGLGGYLLLPKKNAPLANIPTTKNANTNTTKTNEKNSTLYQAEKLNDGAVANHENEKVKSKNEKENSLLTAAADLRQQPTQQSFLKTQKENEVVTNSETQKEVIEKTKEQNETAAIEKQNEENKTATNAEPVSPADSLVIAYNKNAGDAAIVISEEPGNAEKKGDTALAENNEQKKTNTQLSKKITAQKPFQLQWGISVFGGKSNTVLNVFNRLSAGDKAYMEVSSPIPDSVARFNPFTQVKGAAVFGIGGFVQKNISKRSSISAGINFSYLQTRINAVRHIDSIGIFQNAGGLFNLDGYYRPSVYSYQVPYSSTQSVKNTYILLDLPVAYHYRITNSAKWPLYANAGLSAAFLLHKKALLYDLPNTVYYYGANQYRTIQLHTTFGFAAQLQVNKKYALQFGPQLKYGLTNITSDKKTYGKQHFLQYGLQVNLLFRKK